MSGQLAVRIQKVLIAVLCVAAVLLQVQSARAASFTVNTTDSTGTDANPGNGVCATSTGTCTLRAAIQEANAYAGTDTISFAIGSGAQHIVVTGSQLPDITTPMIIDATTQPGYAGVPLIRVSGNVNDGLRLRPGSGGSTVKGLMLTNFIYSGIYIDHSNNNVIQSNYIGTDGTSDLGNRWGTFVSASSGTQIGGTAAGQGNLISGNNWDGINLSNGTSGTLIRGNYIGTNAAGTAAIGNEMGVKIDNSPNNTIGGTVAGVRNILSGNTKSGVYIYNTGATGNLVQGNYIGTMASGDSALGNINTGVHIQNASSNTVGGSSSNARNVISGNLAYQLYVERTSGVASNNIIQGNMIGYSADGITDITPNTLRNAFGVVVYGGANTSIGGANPALGNVIRGVETGVQIAYHQSSGTTVQNNMFDFLHPVGISNPYTVISLELWYTSNITIGGSGAGNIFRDGTYPMPEGQGIQLFNSYDIVIQANTFTYAGTVQLEGSSAKITENIFDHGGPTAQLWLDSTSSLLAGSSNNCFYMSDNYAVKSDNPSTQTFENNWWGATGGPGAYGNSVAGAVDVSPWHATVTARCKPLHNTLNDTSFESGRGVEVNAWTGYGHSCNPATPAVPVLSGYCAYRMTGLGYIEQTKTHSGNAGEQLELTAYSYALSVPSSFVVYRMILTVYYTDGTTGSCTQNFSTGTHSYEFKACTVVTAKAFSSYKARLEYSNTYDYTTGTVYFENVYVYRIP